MKNSVLFLNKGPHAASSRYRATMYQRHFENADWDFQEMPCNDGFISRLKILNSARKYRWVVIQRKLFGPIFLRLLKRANNNIVFDFDDAIFLKSSGQLSGKRQRNFINVAKIAKRVWGGNRYLVNQAKDLGASAEVIPTAINIEAYKAKTFEDKNNDSLTLIWIGSSSTRQYLDKFKETFEEIGKAIPRLKLLVVADFEFSLENIDVESIRWSLKSEQESLLAADIGIAPMTDNPWTKGKCALKVLQYMAAGLPVISSDCGTNAEVVAEGKTGYLGDTAESWIKAINQLKDIGHRAQFGRKGREIVENEFTTLVCFEKMLKSLKKST